MVRWLLGAPVLAGCLLLAGGAAAQRDRTVIGDDLVIEEGESVRDATAFGGDVIVRGTVERDAVAFGGDVIVEGEVERNASAFGGGVEIEEDGVVRGDVISRGGSVDGPVAPLTIADRSPLEGLIDWVAETARSAVAHVLLFLLGLLLIGVSRERLGALQLTILKDGVRSAGVGVIGYFAAVLAIVLLAISIVGIPVAVVLGLALPVATYIGLAAMATILGAALPFPQLKGREVWQLAAGVAVLFVCSRVPLIGSIATAAAACVGFGALIRTRFAKWPPKDLPSAGPYRSPAEV